MNAVISYFFTGFFSNKQSKRFLEYPLILPFISTLFFFLVSTVATLGGYNLSFSNYYNNAPEYHTVLQEVFSEGTTANSKGNSLLDTNFTICSFSIEKDKEKYSQYGFDVVVDTRPKETTYDDFEYYCLLKTDNNVRISYDEYLSYSDAEKEKYNFTMQSRGIYLDVIAKIPAYEKYITEHVTDLSGFNALKAKYENKEITQLEYANNLYVMYAKAYFPSSVFELDYYGYLPTLRSYYMSKYNNNSVSRKYIYVFEEFMFSVFDSGGRRVNYTGYYNNNMHYEFTKNDIEKINAFINDCYMSGTSQRIPNFIFSSFLSSVVLFVAFLLVSYIFNVVSRNNRYREGLLYLNNCRLVGSFIVGATWISCLIMFGLSFVITRNTIFFISLLLPILIVALRAIFFYYSEFRLAEKNHTNNAKL